MDASKIADAVRKSEERKLNLGNHKFNPKYNKCFSNNKMAEPIDILKFTETLNKDAVDYLCNFTDKQLKELIYDGGEIYDENGDKYNVKTYIKSVISYLKDVKKNNYTIRKRYKYSQTLIKHKEGRLFVKNFGVQSLQFRLRGFLLNGLWHDYDMKNAHPTLLLKMVQKENNDLETMFLENYIKNRKKVLDKHQLDKLDILKSINSDKFIRTKNEFLKGFDKEMKVIQEFFYNKYKSKYETTNKDNPKGSLLNILLCIQENNVLRKVINYCHNNEIDICCPMFDGLLINKPGLIDTFNNITKDDGIIWDIKKHDTSIEIDEEELENPYLYKNVKEEFEKEHFMTLNPLIYWKEIDDPISNMPKVIAYNKSDFKSLTATYEYEGAKGLTNFFNKWETDKSRRSYTSIDFCPPPLVCPPNVYNLYKGMKYESWKGVEYDDNTDISMYYNHLKLLSNYDDKVYNFILDFMAHLIKKPGLNPQVSMLFKSIEGIGKNMFFDNFMTECLGLDYYKPDAILDDLIGTFVDNSQTFMTILNELNGSDGFKSGNEDKLKKVITAPYQIRHDKGLKKIENIRNCMRIIIFTNNKIPLKISKTDRRFGIFECSDNIPPSEYFCNLNKCMKDKSKLLKFIDELKKRDVPDIFTSKDIPCTEYKEELSSVSIPLIAKFLQFYLECSVDEDIQITSTDFYKNFKRHITKYERDMDFTMTKFGRDIKEYNGIEKKRSRNGMYYIIRVKEVINYLKEKNYFDEVPFQDIDDETFTENL